jgi:hypothetical protein
VTLKSALRFAVLLVAALVWGQAANAASIAILKPSTSSPAVTEALFRIQGELLALGIEVPVAERESHGDLHAGDARAWLEGFAAERGIDAVIDVRGEEVPTAVDVWIFERSPRRSRMSRVALAPNTPNAAETLAIRAIEVLRSNFLEIDLLARARQPDTLVVRTDEASPVPKAPGPSERIGFGVGAALLTSIDGIGPAIMPLARFDLALGPWLAAQATLAGSGTRPTLRTETGSARVSQHYGVVGLATSLPSQGTLRLVLGLAAGALRTSLEGQADLPERGHEINRWSFLMEGGVGGRVHLPGRFYVTLGGHVHVAQPAIDVYFVDTRIASSGRPNLVGSLTVSTWL